MFISKTLKQYFYSVILGVLLFHPAVHGSDLFDFHLSKILPEIKLPQPPEKSMDTPINTPTGTVETPQQHLRSTLKRLSEAQNMRFLQLRLIAHAGNGVELGSLSDEIEPKDEEDLLFIMSYVKDAPKIVDNHIYDYWQSILAQFNREASNGGESLEQYITRAFQAANPKTLMEFTESAMNGYNAATAVISENQQMADNLRALLSPNR